MLKRIFQKIMMSFGKKYDISDSVPDRLLIAILLKRGVMLFRGFIRTRKQLFCGRYVRLHNVRAICFGKNCTLENNVTIDGYSSGKVTFGSQVKIGSYTKVLVTSYLQKMGEGLVMGNNCSVGDFSFLGCAGGITIGNDVIMGQYVSFHSENHNFSNKNLLIREQGVNHKGIQLGNNIWVGAKVTFLDGAIVGDNSVVAAGAVVSGHFPPNVIIGGVPAKILKEL
jgi:acetyltransferase-like isoleucine patch superfamily enzyme